MISTSAYILAGGKSTRFGSDKARAELEGEPLIARVHRLLKPIVSDITVVSAQFGEYDDLGLRTIADINPGLGPLAGLQSALADLPGHHEELLLCPCDAVVIMPKWVEELYALSKYTPAAVYRSADRWQPLPGFFTRACVPAVEVLLSGKGRSLQRLLDLACAQWLLLPDDWPPVWQVNSPQELQRFVDLA